MLENTLGCGITLDFFETAILTQLCCIVSCGTTYKCAYPLYSVPLAGKDKAVEVKSMGTLVALLKDSEAEVRANAAGAIMM